jgi:hypothetical protein
MELKEAKVYCEMRMGHPIKTDSYSEHTIAGHVVNMLFYNVSYANGVSYRWALFVEGKPEAGGVIA